MIVYISRLLSPLSDGNIQSQKRREINTMTYTNIRLFTANGIPEALSNLGKKTIKLHCRLERRQK